MFKRKAKLIICPSYGRLRNHIKSCLGKAEKDGAIKNQRSSLAMLFNESLEGVLQESKSIVLSIHTVSSALVENGVEKNIIFGKTPTLASN